MPPPRRNLSNIFVSSRSERLNPALVTPRTPHSRSGRAEEALEEVELDDIHDDDGDTNDERSPFLSSSTSSLFSTRTSSATSAGYRSRGDDHEILFGGMSASTVEVIVQRFFWISGIFMLCGMLAIFMMALKSTKGNWRDALWMTHWTGSLPPSALTPERMISYETYIRFPLTGQEYKHECEKAAMWHVSYLHHRYWDWPLRGPLDVLHTEPAVDLEHVQIQPPICSQTITYMLDGTVGLATDLALLAQVAALARQRGSTFLIDDSHWNRGKWTDHFQDVRTLQPGPQPGCRAPPPEELVACPRTARHWVVSASTASFHLGEDFEKEFHLHHIHGIYKIKPVFDAASDSLTGVVRPNERTYSLIATARSEIVSILSLSSVNQSSIALPPRAPYIGVQIRRGDLKSNTTAYKDTYVPLPTYASQVRTTWTHYYPDAPLPADYTPDSAPFPAPPVTYVATDSPEALRDYTAAFVPSTAMFALDLSTDADLRALASSRMYDQETFAQEAEEERVRMTRGAIVDLALLSGLWAEKDEIVPGATICTGSSNICQLSAVGLGWERAFAERISNADSRWVDVEQPATDAVHWKGFNIP